MRVLLEIVDADSVIGEDMRYNGGPSSDRHNRGHDLPENLYESLQDLLEAHIINCERNLSLRQRSILVVEVQVTGRRNGRVEYRRLRATHKLPARRGGYELAIEAKCALKRIY